VELLAAIRPDDWNLPLFLHVLGAMVATGALVLALAYFGAAWSGRSRGSLRAGYKALLYAGIPGFLVMRLSAQWLYAKEHLDELPVEPVWLDVGWAVGDPGLLLLLIATIVSGRASREVEATGPGESAPDDLTATGGIKVATVAAALLLVAYVVAVWAMSTKPI
jgi:hypothetical protein